MSLRPSYIIVSVKLLSCRKCFIIYLLWDFTCTDTFYFLTLLLGCVQRLPDPAMLTQGSQGMRYCNDTERRVSALQMSQYFLMVVMKCSHDLSRYFCGRRRGLIRRAREGLLERNNNLARAANEITDMRTWWNALSCGACEEALGPQTPSATSISASSSLALPTAVTPSLPGHRLALSVKCG